MVFGGWTVKIEKTNLTMNYFWLFLGAAVAELFLLWVGFRIFPKLNLLDKPAKYGLNRSPIPYGGGVLIFLVFGLAALLFLPWTANLFGILGGAFLLVTVSFIDDFRPLPPHWRLLAQFLAALAVIGGGAMIGFVAWPFAVGGGFDLGGYLFWGWPVVAVLATAIWILFVTNMLNWIDGVNGLAGGVALISLAAIFALALRPNFHTVDQTAVLVMGGVLIAALAVFLFFEFWPARFLMGDAGTMFLGFMIAVLAIVSGGKLATAFIVLALPIMDGFWVILRRLYEKKSPFKGDLWHFHHRLLYLGFSPRQVLAVYYALTAFFAVAALLLTAIWKFLAIVILFVVVSVVEVYFYRRQQKSDSAA